jgi:hypothetical protein
VALSVPLQPFAVPVAVCQSLSRSSLSLWQCQSLSSPLLSLWQCQSLSSPSLSLWQCQSLSSPSLSLPIVIPLIANTKLYGLHTGCSNNVQFCRHCYNCQLIQQTAVSQCHHVSPRVTTYSNSTYQTRRLDGSQEVDVGSDPNLEGPSVVGLGQPPTIIPAGVDQRFQQVCTTPGNVDCRTDPVQKHGGYRTQRVCVNP